MSLYLIDLIGTALMKNCCLTSLWIEECDIDAKGIECFKKLLFQTQCLKRLVLDANPIRDQGAKFLGKYKPPSLALLFNLYD